MSYATVAAASDISKLHNPSMDPPATARASLFPHMSPQVQRNLKNEDRKTTTRHSVEPRIHVQHTGCRCLKKFCLRGERHVVVLLLLLLLLLLLCMSQGKDFGTLWAGGNDKQDCCFSMRPSGFGYRRLRCHPPSPANCGVHGRVPLYTPASCSWFTEATESPQTLGYALCRAIHALCFTLGPSGRLHVLHLTASRRFW